MAEETKSPKVMLARSDWRGWIFNMIWGSWRTVDSLFSEALPTWSNISTNLKLFLIDYGLAFKFLFFWKHKKMKVNAVIKFFFFLNIIESWQCDLVWQFLVILDGNIFPVYLCF